MKQFEDVAREIITDLDRSAFLSKADLWREKITTALTKAYKDGMWRAAEIADKADIHFSEESESLPGELIAQAIRTEANKEIK